MSDRSTARMVLWAIAVAVAIRCVWPARQPSPKKWPASRTPTTASLPACDNTDTRTAPVSTNMMLVAGSPCAKITASGLYSTRWVRAPAHSGTPTGVGVGARFAFPMAGSRAVEARPARTEVDRRVLDIGPVEIDTNIWSSQTKRGSASDQALQRAFAGNGPPRESRGYTVATADIGIRGRSMQKMHPLPGRLRA